MIIFYVFIVVFLFKIAINFLFPYALLVSAIRKKGGGVSTSLFPPIEIPLLLVILALSLIITEHQEIFTIQKIFLWGGGLMLFSYLHMVAFFIIANLVVIVINKIGYGKKP